MALKRGQEMLQQHQRFRETPVPNRNGRVDANPRVWKIFNFGVSDKDGLIDRGQRPRESQEQGSDSARKHHWHLCQGYQAELPTGGFPWSRC